MDRSAPIGDHQASLATQRTREAAAQTRRRMTRALAAEADESIHFVRTRSAARGASTEFAARQ
eukprot:1873245-Pyramimonas_sp.AAC.1